MRIQDKARMWVVRLYRKVEGTGTWRAGELANHSQGWRRAHTNGNNEQKKSVLTEEYDNIFATVKTMIFNRNAH
jgi:hypothetical protein